MGIAESFPSAPTTACNGLIEQAAEHHQNGAERIDAEAVRALVEDKSSLTRWPHAIRALYAAEIDRRIERDQYFLHFLGLMVCFGTLVIDAMVSFEIAHEGAILRLLMVTPITALGLLAAVRGWRRIGAITLGAAPVAFMALVAHLAMHMPPDQTARYLIATALVLGIGNITQPFSTRGLIAFNLATIVAVTTAIAVYGWGALAHHGGYLIILAMVAGATLAIAQRIERLRQHNFLLNLHARVTAEELLVVNERLRDLSNRDPLTGLPNRRFFNRLFDEMVTERNCKCSAGDAPACRVVVLMLDLDHFKAFNDTHGHAAGDEALRIVGHELASIMQRADGIAARYGGEEFVAALCKNTNAEAEAVAEEIRQTVGSLVVPVWPSGRSVITTSVGLALAPWGMDDSLEALIATADEALYQAKRGGRDRVSVIDLVIPPDDATAMAAE